MEKALVIIPTYNEKENISEIVPAVLEQDDRIHILIVDDNSPDGTGQIADRLATENSRVFVLHRQQKQGLGRAYIAGFTWALEKKFDFIFEMDADFSHDPFCLPVFLQRIKDCDLVLGSRYISGANIVNWPMKRMLLSYTANIVARWVTGTPVRDSTGGFKCFRREVLEKINLNTVHSDGYSFQIEINFNVWKMGFHIEEIPIVFVDRRKGTSKMSSKIIREAFGLLWRMRVVNLFRPITRIK